MKDAYTLKPIVNAIKLHNITLDNELIEAAQVAAEAKKKYDKYIEEIQPRLDALTESCQESNSKYRYLLNKYDLAYYLEPEDLLDFEYVFSMADATTAITFNLEENK